MNVSFLNNKLGSQFAYIVARGTSRFKFSDTSRHDTSPMACRYPTDCVQHKAMIYYLLKHTFTATLLLGIATTFGCSLLGNAGYYKTATDLKHISDYPEEGRYHYEWIRLHNSKDNVYSFSSSDVSFRIQCMNVSRHLIGVGPPFLPLIPIIVLELTNADKRGRTSIIIKLDIQAQDSTARITIDPNELGLTFSKNKSRLNFDRLEFVDEGNNPRIPPILIKSEMVLESPKGILKLSYELDNWSMPRELAVNLNGFKCNNSVVFPDQIQFVRATRWEYIGFFIFN